MIDLTEELIPLAQVPDLPFVPRRRQKKRLNVATVFRWAQRGVRGHVLETIRFGGTLCTSRSALLAFFRALSGHAATPGSTARRRHNQAEKELTAAGI